ncbi:MAG: YraN family protein [Peptococcaceae bacterium]|nr:YraN family protein [Peptococcaceae bacterium]
MFSRKEFGERSERQAEKYLRAHKHRIIARNFSGKQGEIDLISVLPGKTIVFTEVRSKHDIVYGHPAETVDQRKQQKIRATAESYLLTHKQYDGYSCRFDVITIVGEGKEMVLEHFPDAF